MIPTISLLFKYLFGGERIRSRNQEDGCVNQRFEAAASPISECIRDR